jgi:hypothetical protein
VGYLDGDVIPELNGGDGGLYVNCSVCDTANGYCRAALPSGNGELCGLCAACDTSRGAVLNATDGYCYCGPRHRGPACDECLPQYSGANCSACAPGYANPPACDACDTGAGFCGMGKPATASVAWASVIPMFLADAATPPFYPRLGGSDSDPTQGTPRVILSALIDPWLSFCAPCDACHPIMGSLNATAATCTCVNTNRSTLVPGAPKNYTRAAGPSCTLRSEVPGLIFDGGCFPGASRVRTRLHGWVQLAHVATGTEVLAADATTGALRYSPIVAWWHAAADVTARFTKLRAASGASLSLTANHFLHVSPHGCALGWASAQLTLPGAVRLGDGLWTAAGDASLALSCSRVTAIEAVFSRGAFAPVTASGAVLVDGVSASSLVAYGPWPLRILQAHHALLVALHAAFGQLGLALMDALHAPFYWRAGVAQPTAAWRRSAQAASGTPTTTTACAADVAWSVTSAASA